MMVIFLNYLPWLILLTSAGIGYYWLRKGKLSTKRVLALAAGTVAVIVLLQAATPSYMPKAEVKRLPNPQFEQKEAEVEDRLKKPELSTEERQKRFDEKFNAVEQATSK